MRQAEATTMGGSRDSVGLATINVLRMVSDEITEWVPLDCKDRLDRPLGVPVGIENARP